MAASRVQSETRPYQGYPFVNPVVIDVPSLDAATAAKWANLPRKPLITTVQHPKIDSSPNNTDRVNGAGSSGKQKETSIKIQEPDEEDAPVVYIDMPEQTERDDTRRQQDGKAQDNTAFVEETIFYDPFENRQIDVNNPKDATGPETASSTSRPSPSVPAPSSSRPTRPVPPANLILQPPGPSGSVSSAVPSFMSKESQLYGSQDGFSLSPLPVSDHPEPPPAYSELAPPTATTQPPRTVVVGPDSSAAVGIASSTRKLVECRRCGLRVHTVVVRENGAFTHLVALITVLLCILPVTVVVYCTDFFKYRVHFCPHCNHAVGYEIPVLCQSMVYH